MDFDKVARKAQQIYTKRGGAEAAHGGAAEVEGILEGQGTFIDRAKPPRRLSSSPAPETTRV